MFRVKSEKECECGYHILVERLYDDDILREVREREVISDMHNLYMEHLNSSRHKDYLDYHRKIRVTSTTSCSCGKRFTEVYEEYERMCDDVKYIERELCGILLTSIRKCENTNRHRRIVKLKRILE